MKVWIGYEVYCDGCNEYESAARVFDSEEKALAWMKEFKNTKTDYRNIDSFEVE